MTESSGDMVSSSYCIDLPINSIWPLHCDSSRLTVEMEVISATHPSYFDMCIKTWMSAHGNLVCLMLET